MAATTGYRWHLRRLMAEKDMYATTQLVPIPMIPIARSGVFDRGGSEAA